MLKDHQIQILMLVHELEKSLGDVYVLFSEKFPEHNDMWNVLIKEEREHAEAARKLYQLTYEDQALFDEGDIKAEAIQSIIDYIKGICEAARRGKYTAMKAISITCDIENSLIEKNIFSHFKVSPQFAKMLYVLDEGTKAHALFAKKKLDEILKK